MALALGLMAAQAYLGIVTQKRPHKFTFQELLDSNKGDETKPIPYIRGQWKTKPQRIWLGDFSARAVERDSVWTDYVIGGLIGGVIGGIALAALLDTITVSYRYYVGQGFALTWGPINRVHQIYVQDLPCAVAPTVDNAGGSILLDDPSLFGGDQPPGAGGIYGVGDVIPGTYTQARNPYINSVEGNIPALRGVAALVIRGRSGATESGYFSAGVLELREWQVELMAWPDVLNTGDARLPDNSYNRIHSMYEWATAADYGAQYPVGNIHLPSWRAAAATCYTDGLGFSGEINTGGNVGEIFGELKASVDAETYEHPRDGLKIKLIRKDYSLPSIPVLDESNTNSIDEYTPGDYDDTFNKVTLNYVNAANNYQPRPAVYEDPANFTLQQRVSSKQVNYPGVASAELAQKLVTRDGRALAQPFPPLVANAGTVGRDLWPGDVFKFEWTDPFVSKIFRIHARTPSVSFQGERNWKFVTTEDQYSIGLSVFGTSSAGGATNPGDIWATAPPSASWDAVAIPPNGLVFSFSLLLAGQLGTIITGAIEFGVYAGGQYARIYVTEPGGVERLSPMRLSPDLNNKAQFNWPALLPGTYTFCVQTYSIVRNTTNGVKVCETTVASSPSVSPSASSSPSVSPSVSPSGSASPSSSLSPSVSPSGSGSLSVSSSGSQSSSASVSPSSSVSPSASTSPSSSASPSTPPADFDYTNMLWRVRASDILAADVVGGVLVDAALLTTWQDTTANNYDWVGTGAKPNYETNQINTTLPAVRFNRAGNLLTYLTGPDISSIGLAELDLFVLVKLALDPPVDNSLTGLWRLNDAAGTFSATLYPYSDSIVRQSACLSGGSDIRLTVNPTPSLANWCLYRVCAKTGTGLYEMWLDGTSIATTTNNTLQFPATTELGRSTSSGGNFYLNGWVTEYFAFSSKRTAGEANAIRDYFNTYYGLSIA